MPVHLRFRRNISFHDVACIADAPAVGLTANAPTVAVVASPSVAAGSAAVALAANTATVSRTSGGWPTSLTTGYDPALTLVDFNGGTITDDGAVITGRRITSTIYIEANNVTFRDCLMQPSTSTFAYVEDGYNGLTIEDCRIWGGGLGVPKNGLTIQRCHIGPDPGAGYRSDGLFLAWSAKGYSGSGVLIEDNFFEPQWGDGAPPGGDGDHTDCIQFALTYSGLDDVVVNHNWIDSTNVSNESGAHPVGGGLFMADGQYTNVVVTNNMFTRTNDVGGYYHLRLACDVSPTSGHVITGNRFGQQGSVEPIDLFQMTAGTFSDNRYYPSLDLISAP